MSLQALDGKDDAYMFGFGGPISENVEKPMVFKGFFEGPKGQEHSKSGNKQLRIFFFCEKATKNLAKREQMSLQT